MAINFPIDVFQYSGTRYQFQATIGVVDYDAQQEHELYHLNNNEIEEFSYVNSLNSLCLEGSILFNDVEGMLINYINKQYIILDIRFVVLKTEGDGTMKVEKEDPENTFNHRFIVTNAYIVKREGGVITYKFDLISEHYYQCISTIDYTNYNKDKEQIFDIIKNCLQKCAQEKFTIDTNTFDKVKSVVKLHYITNGNDNAFTIVKFLLNKMYYYEDKDESLKFILYNEDKKRYQLFDLNQLEETKDQQNKIILSMFRTKEEEYTYQNLCNISTVTKFPKNKVFKSVSTKTLTDYSIQKNEFFPQDIESKQILKYYNKTIDDGKKTTKLSNLFTTDLDYNDKETYWNNSLKIYNDMQNELFQDNSLVINTVGIIHRRPSDVVFIAVPPDPTNTVNQDEPAYKDLKCRYDQLQGTWLTAKVRHIVHPNLNEYRQNLVLFKNFIELNK